MYTNSLPCDRCLKTGQAVNCQYIPKLPSLVLPEYPSSVSTLPPVNSTGFLSGPLVPTTFVNQKPSLHEPQGTKDNDLNWKSQLESKIDTFDNKLNDLVDIMKQQQQLLIDQQKLNHQQQPQLQLPRRVQQIQAPSQAQIPYPYNSAPQYNLPPSNFAFGRTQSPAPYHHSHSTSPEDSPILPPLKKFKSEIIPKDFREGYLSKDQAEELFGFFNTNISQQLFGFEISKISVDSIWASCPILVCAICTIASIHHPILSEKSKQLQIYLHELSGSLILKGKPKDEQDGFNTIVALILCSFWLSDSQMFTGLALQLAKEYGLNNPYTKNKDNLKLWYLLYILDGQQSLTFNRQPLFNANDYTFKNSRDILLSDSNKRLENKKSKKLLENGTDKSTNNENTQKNELIALSTRFTDLRLVSQVEYNQAINEAFKGNAWELLAPSSFGIPSRSNMELDKWMVSWTVLLAPGNHGAVWSSKSTLIYYNFAKMSINSRTVQRLTVNPNTDDNMLPRWQDVKEQESSRPTHVHQQRQGDDDDEFSSDNEFEDDDEFISSKLVVQDDAVVNANIAVNAASTVLHLVTSDNDILENLKYVPVHIHIMIYYAALLLINPPIDSKDKSLEFQEYYIKIIGNLRLIKTLQKKIYANLPIDTKFGDKLIGNLNDMVFDKLKHLKSEINELEDTKLRHDLLNQLNSFYEDESTLYEMVDSSGVSSSGSTPKPEKISAWPGSHHGHP